MRVITLLLFVLSISTAIQAADFSLYEFLKQHQSVKSFARAGADVSASDGAQSILQNPAGLATPGAQASLSYLDYNNDAIHLNKHITVYASPIGYAYSEIQDSSANYARAHRFGVAYADNKGLSWGLSYKSIKYTIDNTKGNGWSSDFGIRLRLYPWLTMGLSLNDVYRYNIDVPTTGALGFSGQNESSSLLWSVQSELDKQNGDNIISSVGLEYALSPALALRAGLKQDMLFAGTGMGTEGFKVDMGLATNLSDDTVTDYRIALSLGASKQSESYKNRFSIMNQENYAVFSIGSNLVTGKSEFSIFGGQKIGSNDVLNIVHQVNEDDTCQGYIIRIASLSSSLSSVALIQEIRSELEQAKQFGKKIVVYLEGPASLSEYYLASIADVIIMPPMAGLSQFGLKIEINKMTEFFEQLGIKKEVLTSGEHKGATAAFTKPLSYVDRKLLSTLVESLFDDVSSDIAASRADINDSLHHISDGRLITAKQALELNLVDHLAYWPDVLDILELEKKQLIPIVDFIKEPGNKSLSSKSFFIPRFNRIVVIEVDGPIGLGQNEMNILFGGQSTGADEFDDIVDAINDDATIKGVILRINSPGGSILASDRIYQAVERLKKEGKVVYSSMGNMATSGGYYIALNSHKIFANKSTLTGSIGVISTSTSFAALKKSLGIKNEKIMTGKHMDLYSLSAELSDEQRQLLQASQDSYYQDFVNKVKLNRQLSDKEVYEFAQGQLMKGGQAKDLHLIDDLGGLYDVVQQLSDELGIKDPELLFARKEASFSLGQLLRSGSQASLFKPSFSWAQPLLSPRKGF